MCFPKVLKVVKLQGALFFNAEYSSPWSFCSPQSRTVAPHVAPGAHHVIIYHLLTEGRASARLLDGQRILLTPATSSSFPTVTHTSLKTARRPRRWTWCTN